MNGERLWRWILRITGLAGIFIGAHAKPPWPDVAFLIFAAMIGLDKFIEFKNGKKK